MNLKKKLAALVLVVCMGAAVYLGYLAAAELLERKSGADYYESLALEWIAPEATAAASASPAAQSEKSEVGETFERLNIDFDALKKSCPDVVGWIKIDGTQIDYPIVQGENNQFYLNHLPGGAQNSAGSIMMDIACRADFGSGITILHGHNMRSGAMFGNLDLYYKADYFAEHPVVRLATPDGEYVAQIFAGYTVDGETFGYPSGFATEAEFDAFVADARRKSNFTADVDVKWGDRLLLLSTCAYSFENARFVVLAKLVGSADGQLLPR